MTQARTILFCGGGSLGHLIPSVAIAEELLRVQPALHVLFLHAPRSDERALLAEHGYASLTISAPKFPRGISLSLLSFPFHFLSALLQSFRVLRRVRPSVIFTNGGYISVCPCLAAFFLGIPVVLHISDAVPNLSDRFIGGRACSLTTGFPLSILPPSLRRHAVYTGNPVRSVILNGSRDRGLAMTKFSGSRPIVLIMGGSQGARAMNEEVDRSFEALIRVADIIHLTGVGKSIARTHPAYVAMETSGAELADFYAAADIVVTRAGASSLAELSALGKPTIVLPLEGVAHNHQLRNAEYLVSKGAAELLRENQYDVLAEMVSGLVQSPGRRHALSDALSHAFPRHAAFTIATVVLDVLALRG